MTAAATATARGEKRQTKPADNGSREDGDSRPEVQHHSMKATRLVVRLFAEEAQVWPPRSRGQTGLEGTKYPERAPEGGSAPCSRLHLDEIG